jgi:transcriptional regulator with GAF, ATPase, and Fis domain
MTTENKVDIGIFKVITRSIARSHSLETMSEQLTQLLVGALGIKGCSILLLNPETEELEILTSFGLSINYLNKGPLAIGKDHEERMKQGSIVIADIEDSAELQYPEEARKEGIRAMVSLPVQLHEKLVGVLRLYHYEAWDVSEPDLDSLSLLAEVVGLAVMYTRILTAFKTVKDVVREVHPIWLEEGV